MAEHRHGRCSECRPRGGIGHRASLLAFLPGLVFALLVGNAAAGLASGLARGLAFAAAAVLGAFAKLGGGQGLNVFHGFILPISVRFQFIVAQAAT